MQIMQNLVLCALCIWVAQAAECPDSSDACQDSVGMLQSKVSIDVVKPHFDIIDKNTDNKFERDELQLALDNAEVENPLFGDIDTDGNANIDVQELANALDKGIIADSTQMASPSPASPPTVPPGFTTVEPPTLPPTLPPGAPTPEPPPTKGPELAPRVPKGGAVVGQPYICGAYMNGASFHDRKCYCNGDVYYGKKYRSGKSGPQLTFEEMITIDGGWKNWGNKSQRVGAMRKPYEDLKKKASFHPEYRMTFCGGCKWFKSHLYGGKYGEPKHCWCMPKYLATTPPPTTSTTREYVPPPPGGEHVWG